METDAPVRLSKSVSTFEQDEIISWWHVCDCEPPNGRYAVDHSYHPAPSVPFATPPLPPTSISRAIITAPPRAYPLSCAPPYQSRGSFSLPSHLISFQPPPPPLSSIYDARTPLLIPPLKVSKGILTAPPPPVSPLCVLSPSVSRANPTVPGSPFLSNGRGLALGSKRKCSVFQETGDVPGDLTSLLLGLKTSLKAHGAT